MIEVYKTTQKLSNNCTKARHAVDQNRSVEIAIARINALDLMSFDQALFLEKKGKPTHTTLRRTTY